MKDARVVADKAYLSIEEVARHFGFNASTVYRLVERGELPALKIGGRWRFSRELLDRWVADRVTMKWLKAAGRKAPTPTGQLRHQ